MAEIIKEHFGDKLACPDLLENGMLPSPEDLKYKVVRQLQYCTVFFNLIPFTYVLDLT